MYTYKQDLKMSRARNNARKKATTKTNRRSVRNEEHVKIRKKNTVIINNSKKMKVKRKLYSVENLEHALDALKTGLSIRKAALAYGVPVATLARKKQAAITLKKRSGPSTVLLPKEEEEVVTWILYRAERGYPVTKNELLDSVQQYVILKGRTTPFINNRPGRRWYEGFRRRHPNITLRTAQHLSLSRVGVTQECLKEWFSEQCKFLKSKNLIGISPTRVFNCDESNIMLCPDSDKVLTRKGAAVAYKVTDGGKEGITTLFMYSAAGTRAPPMVMYPYKENLPKKIVEGMPAGWGIGISESGWMTTETFFEYITNVFYPWLLKEKIEFPVIIYLDNHSSHINFPLVTFCRLKQIEVIALYPNSTHIMQPLDISFFHPFKLVWKKTVIKWKNEKNVLKLKKENFAAVLKMALNEMKEEKNVIVSGFRAAGLVPFDEKAIDYDILIKKKRKSPTGEDDHSVPIYQASNHSSFEDTEQHLRKFESNILPELLEEFKSSLAIGVWTGESENKGLFEYWLSISKKSLGT